MASYFAVAREDYDRAVKLRPEARIVVDFSLKPGQWYVNHGNVPLPARRPNPKALPIPLQQGRGVRRG